MSAAAVKEDTGDAALFFADRAREITEFCVKRGGHAFDGWEVRTLFQYVFFHVVCGTAFCTRAHGTIASVGFMWGVPEREIRSRDIAGEPVFHWARSQDSADSFFIAEIAGRREELPRLCRMAARRFPNWWTRKVFTYRPGLDGKPKLVQLPRETIERMTQ